MMVTLRKTAPPAPNPYVGPRPFEATDHLYGREDELRALRDMLIAERIVLLHSPSGAGKTSLIQASLTAALERKGFLVHGPLRVNAPPPDGDVNRYLWSLVLGLQGVSAEDAEGSLAAALDRLDESEPDDRGSVRRVLILDQFEEVLTLNPADLEGQQAFFADLGRALENDHRWALLSMREDYMGGLARFAVEIPTHLRVRFRLDFLGWSAAREAVQGPARDHDVEFTDPAASRMVKELATVRVQVPGRDEPDELPSPYVEPFQLQVVCAGLWQKLQKNGGKLARIDEKHVEKYARTEKAMRAYYADAVADVARETKTSERAIRDWFEDALITRQGFRRQSSTGPDVGADVAQVLAKLEKRYVIRSENRRGANWYELSHDNLVKPVQRDNARWRQEHLPRWEWAADLWNRSERQPEYLAHGPDVEAARQWLKEHGDEGRSVVREYVDASAAKQGNRLAARHAQLAALCFWIALLELVVIVYLVIG